MGHGQVERQTALGGQLGSRYGGFIRLFGQPKNKAALALPALGDLGSRGKLYAASDLIVFDLTNGQQQIIRFAPELSSAGVR